MTLSPFIHQPIDIRHLVNGLYRLACNKHDTEAAHLIAVYSDGRSMERHFKAFASADFRPDPKATASELRNSSKLMTMGQATLGRHYACFMEQNGFDLESFNALSEERHLTYIGRPDVSDLQKRWFDMNNLCHDLYHVVGGYGTDALGEICVQAFVAGQTGSRSGRLIAFLGTVAAAVTARSSAVIKMVHFAYRQGRRAGNFALQDWSALLSTPLDEVRHGLNVRVNDNYLTAAPVLRSRVSVGGSE